MPTKQRKPINSSSRFQTHLTFEEITRERPEKALTDGANALWLGLLPGFLRKLRLIDAARRADG